MRIALTLVVAATSIGCGTRSGLPLPDETAEATDGLCNELEPSRRFCARELGYREPYFATNGHLEGGDYELLNLGQFASGSGSLGKITSGELSGRMVIDPTSSTMSLVVVDGRGGAVHRVTYEYTTSGATVKLTPKCGATQTMTGRFSRTDTFLTMYWETDAGLVREQWGRPN